MFRRAKNSVLVLFLTATAVYGHLGYPIYIFFKSRKHRLPPPPDLIDWPSLSIVVPAFREETVIGRTLTQLSASGYPGPLEIIVVADDQPTADAARRFDVQVLQGTERLGKVDAVNRGVRASRHDIVLLTDANATLTPGTLEAAVRHFQDPTVGAVAGEKQVVDKDGAQGFYWRFESWLKRRESATGQTVGVVGEMFAVRRSAFSPLPPDIAIDDTWIAMDIMESGLRVVYEPASCSIESSVESYAEEWERRTRNAAGNLDSLWKRRRLLFPGSCPVTDQLWGHRLIRLSFGPASHLILLIASLVRLRKSRLALLFFSCNAAGLSCTGFLIAKRPLPRAARLVAQVFFLQCVALGGMWRFITGRKSLVIWPKPPRREADDG